MSTQQAAQISPAGGTHLAEQQRLVRRLKSGNAVGTGVLWGVAIIVAFLFVGIIVYLLLQGSAYLFLPQFYGTSDLGVGREIYNTFYILILAEIISLPIALAAAIYLIEYARQGALVTTIHFAAETLAGVPSI